MNVLFSCKTVLHITTFVKCLRVISLQIIKGAIKNVVNHYYYYYLEITHTHTHTHTHTTVQSTPKINQIKQR